MLNRGINNQTDIFDSKKHDSLVQDLEEYLQLNKKHLGTIKIEITQALNDHGVDLLLDINESCKIGFQVKSHFDVQETDFASKVKRQLTESLSHGLDKWFLLICAPLIDNTGKNFTHKISHLMNEMSMYKTDYFCIFGPKHNAALFNNISEMDDLEFKIEVKRFTYKENEFEQILRKLDSGESLETMNIELDLDKMVLEKMRDILPIHIIKDLFYDMNISYQPFPFIYGLTIEQYLKWTASPDNSFVNSKLEKHRVDFNDNLRKYNKLLSENTVFLSDGKRCIISTELRRNDCVTFQKIVTTLNDLSKKIWSDYSEIVRYGRGKYRIIWSANQN